MKTNRGRDPARIELMADPAHTIRFRFWLWLIRVIGVIVPRRLRADWRQEWEAELRCREAMLADWDKLNWKTKLGLLWRSLGAFRDALWLQQLRSEDEMFQDLRYGARMLVRHKNFTAVAVLSLALGIGANTAIFQLLDAVRMRALPVNAPHELAEVRLADMDGARGSFTSWHPTVTNPIWEQIRERQEAFSGLFAWGTNGFNLASGGEVRFAQGLWVSEDFFNALGISRFGRVFTASEEPGGLQRAGGGDQPRILAARVWRRRERHWPQADVVR